jgi:hypothetical protein
MENDAIGQCCHFFLPQFDCSVILDPVIDPVSLGFILPVEDEGEASIDFSKCIIALSLFDS